MRAPRLAMVLFSGLALLCVSVSAHGLPIGYATAVDTNLYSVDFGSGTSTLIGPQGSFLEALALSPDGQLFGTDTGGGLFSLNTSTGLATFIGNTSLGNIEGLDFNGNTLVGTNFDNPTTFYAIDTTTAAATPLTTASTGLVRTFTIQDSNTALAMSDSPIFQTLASINLTTGAVSNLGTVSDDAYGLDFAPDGTLYAVGDEGHLFQINPTNGSLTLIGDTGDHFWLGLALQTEAAVPEPATLSLLGVGLAGAAVRRFRKRR